MARYKPGAAGKFTGKIGQVVIYPRRGGLYGRSTPRKSSKRKSELQLEQQLRMTLASGISKKLQKAIDIGFMHKKAKITPMNAAVQHQIKNAVKGIFPDLYIDYSQVQVSNGSLDHIYTPRISIMEVDQRIKVTWASPENLKLGVEEHDQVQFCLYCETTQQMDFHKNAALRSDREVILDLAEEMITGSTHAWMFLVSADGKRTSSDRYLGKLT